MGLDLDRIEGLCFDVDGTLSDTDDVWVSRFTNLLAPVNFLSPRGNHQRLARWLIMASESPGNVLYETLDRLNLDDKITFLYHRMIKSNLGCKPRLFWMVKGVFEMLATLYSQFPMAIVSARDEMTTNLFLDQFNITQLFKSVVTSQSCRYTKPFPDPVIKAATDMGLHPQQCLMIGDTTVDIRAGKAAGAQTVGVLCGFGTERELRRAGADLILESTAQLKDILGEKRRG